MTALERFEQAHPQLAPAGVGSWQLAVEKQHADPGGLTDHDVLVIEYFGGAKAAATARHARAEAQPPQHIGASSADVPSAPERATTTGLTKAMLTVLAKVALAAIKTLLPPRDQRLDALEARCAANEQKLGDLEARAVSFKGTWKDTAIYQPGDLARRSGSLWVCKLHHCQAVPNQDNGVGWELAVKKGDAR